MIKQAFQKTLQSIRFDTAHRHAIFARLDAGDQAAACLMVSKHLAYDLLSHLKEKHIVDVLERLDPDEATDILQLFPRRKQQELVNTLSHDVRNSVQTLLQFDPETAAGLMNLDYIQVREDETIAEVAKQFKVHEKRTGRLPAVLVLGRDRTLAGYLPGHELGFASPKDTVKKYTRTVPSISAHADSDAVIEQFRAHPHNKMAVIGDDGRVLGIIYSDDVLRLLHERESSSLYDFAGVSDEESVHDNARKKIFFRYKWLIINLGTAFLASFTVGLFDATISKYVLLAVYMPIVAGMGGNAATQTLAVMVRGITLNQIDLHSFWPTMRSEIAAGLVNGLINGVLVAAVVILINHDVWIALVLALAMIANLLVASVFGTIIPLIMKRLGKDPAASATIFITTATDVLGFLAFLGLATVLLA